MVGPRRALVVAGVVLLCLGLSHHGGLAAADGGPGAGGERSAAVVEWAPAGVIPAAVRARAWGDGELVSVVRTLKASLAVPVSLLAWALALSAVASWCVWRCDHRLGRSLPGSPLATLRAPPAS